MARSENRRVILTSTIADPATVFCIDDQACFRDVLRDLVAATPGLIQVGEAGCGQDAIRPVAVLRPDIVLIDVHMPGLDGFETARILAARRRDLVVILISAAQIEPRKDFPPRCAQVALVSKQDLCPRLLLDRWHGRRTR
jgi:two-component system, NarL family, invasion response regulator UvrY